MANISCVPFHFEKRFTDSGDYLLIGFRLSITISNFLLNPCHDYIHQIVLLHLTQFPSRLHFMPFTYAFSATCRSCMLCNKYRMPLHWCLFSIIRDNCRCFAFCNKISGMLPDRIHSFFINIIDVFLFQMKTASKLGISKFLKQLSVPFFFCQ